MPILNDILDHEVFGPVMKEGLAKGLQEGLEKGRQEGLQEGRQQGASRTLRQILSIRFGNIPAWVSGKLEHLSVPELEELVARALNVERLDDLFPGRH